MIAVLFLGLGLMAQAPCATVDQADAGWALVRLPDGELAHLPFPSALPLEGARVCPSGLQLRPPRRRLRQAPIAHAQLEETFR